MGCIMKKRFIASFLLILFMGGLGFAQQSVPKPAESHKYRTILTIAGAGGGFAGGLFVGLSAFDDAVNSDRKVWTTSIIGAGAGAVAGYFVGRALDRQRKKTAGFTVPSEANPHDLRIAPVLSQHVKGVQFALRF